MCTEDWRFFWWVCSILKNANMQSCSWCLHWLHHLLQAAWRQGTSLFRALWATHHSIQSTGTRLALNVHLGLLFHFFHILQHAAGLDPVLVEARKVRAVSIWDATLCHYGWNFFTWKPTWNHLSDGQQFLLRAQLWARCLRNHDVGLDCCRIAILLNPLAQELLSVLKVGMQQKATLRQCSFHHFSSNFTINMFETHVLLWASPHLGHVRKGLGSISRLLQKPF